LRILIFNISLLIITSILKLFPLWFHDATLHWFSSWFIFSLYWLCKPVGFIKTFSYIYLGTLVIFTPITYIPSFPFLFPNSTWFLFFHFPVYYFSGFLLPFFRIVSYFYPWNVHSLLRLSLTILFFHSKYLPWEKL
jgi:hypothetical protein